MCEIGAVGLEVEGEGGDEQWAMGEGQEAVGVGQWEVCSGIVINW